MVVRNSTQSGQRTSFKTQKSRPVLVQPTLHPTAKLANNSLREPFDFFGWAALVTMHGKERVIAPVLRRELKLPVSVVPNVDTDALGTFTGETPRKCSALDAALAKARMALDAESTAAFGIGSEGSFGPHPVVPFVTVGNEIVAILSRDEGLVLVGSDVTTETNCTEAIVTSVDDALEIARRIGFPTHGVIVMGIDAGRASLTCGLSKGIVSVDALRATVARTIALYGAAALQSDMRARSNARPSTSSGLRIATARAAGTPATGPWSASPAYPAASAQSRLI